MSCLRYVRKAWNNPGLFDILYDEETLRPNAVASPPAPTATPMRLRWDAAVEKSGQRLGRHGGRRGVALSPTVSSDRVEDIVTAAYNRFQPAAFSERRLGGQLINHRQQNWDDDDDGDYYNVEEDSNAFTELDVVRHYNNNHHHRLGEIDGYNAAGYNGVSYNGAGYNTAGYSSDFGRGDVAAAQRTRDRTKQSTPRFAYLGENNFYKPSVFRTTSL